MKISILSLKTVFLLMLIAPLSAVAAPDVPEAVKQRAQQFLNMEMYVYETTIAASPDEVAKHLIAHLDYQVQLEQKGILFAAGPLQEAGSDSKFPRQGMVIIRAQSFEEAKAIADADPMHKAGVRTYKLRRWILNEGGFELSVKFSGQRAEIN